VKKNLMALCALSLLVLVGCGSKDKTTNPGDTSPPAEVQDLVVAPLGGTAVRLTWTAPGDDGRAGTATQYDIRYSSMRRTGDAWLAATPIPQSPTPHIAGTGESFTVTDLAGADTLFFAIRAADEVPNWSGWSNVTHTMLDGLAPAAITDLAVGAPVDTAITLIWTAVGDDGRTGRASRYDVRYSANLGAPWGEMVQVHNPPQPREAGQAESLRVGGLSSRTTYQFRIRVADEVPNWSVESNVVTMDPASPPSRITDLATSGSTPTSVTLRWTAPGDDGATTAAASYDIRYAVGSSVPWEQMTPVSAPPIPQTPGSTETFVVEGLVADTGYSFAIQAGDDSANLSPVSNITSGRTADVTPPEAVVDLAIITAAANAVTVRWTNTGDNGMDGLASRVDLRYGESEITEANWTAAQQANALPSPGAPGTTTFFTVNGLRQERTYHFAVKFGDEVPNWSGLSNIVTTTTPDQTAPATVADLVAGLPGATTIQLTWTAPGDDGGTGTATQYDIRSSTALITTSNWASATPVPGIPVPLVGGSIQSFTVEGLLQGTVYYFALKAKDEQENESDLSNVVSSSTLDVIPPEAITDLTAVSSTGNSVSLRWTAPGDDGSTGLAAAYDVRYSTVVITEEIWSSASQVTGEPVPQSHGTVENFSVPGLQGGTRYYFAIKATDDAENWSALSNVVVAETSDQMAPAATTDLTISQVGPTSLRLSWTAAGDDGTTGYASRYDIRSATAPITPQNWASANTVPGAPTPHSAGTAEYIDVTALQQDVVYFFALKTADEVPNWSEVSNVPSAKTLDQVPPAAVTNLEVTGTTATTVSLRWTAPGDNGSSGTAAQYDVRYATGSLNQATWNAVTQASGEPAPATAGTVQTLTIINLQHATTYRFGLKTADEVPNWSGLSSVVTTTTQASDHIRHVPGDYATIQAAIDAGVTGDTVEVASGVYSGDGNRDIDFQGKAVTVRSQSGSPATCILECGGSLAAPHRGFWFHSGESADTRVIGVTIQNGYDAGVFNTGGGGGVRIENYSNPTIRDCSFLSDAASWVGGAIATYDSSPTFVNCWIESCTMIAVHIDGSAPTFNSCTLVNNDGGVHTWSSSPSFVNCTFFNNHGVTIVYVDGGSSVSMQSCIVAVNHTTDPPLDRNTGSMSLSCCDVYGNDHGDWVGFIAGQAGVNGNIALDPLFCDTVPSPGGGYGLCSNSPCRAAASPCGQQIGAGGITCGSCTAPIPVWSGHLDAASTTWLPTATLAAGTRYHLVATGQSRIGFDHSWTNCEGCASLGNCYGTAPADCGCPGPGLPYAGVVGRLCGAVQGVPCDTYIEPSCSGAFELILNDASGWYGDNGGGYDITIYRVE
jgi:hypothetical protein